MRRTKMKTPILSLALGIVLACPVTAYAGEDTNIFEDLLFGAGHSHRAHQETVDSLSVDPFKPRIIDGLSSNVNACASYGCVGAGGGGD
jgi:hypothetical protein